MATLIFNLVADYAQVFLTAGVGAIVAAAKRRHELKQLKKKGLLKDPETNEQ